MLIDSSAFTAIPGLRSATLSESADGTARLTLSYAPDAPGRPQFMDPVTITHRGAVLWHGKVTSSSTTNRAGALEHRVEADNYMWVLDHQTLGSQLLGNIGSATDRDLLRLAHESYESYHALGSSLMINAPGWTCTENGTPNPVSVLGIQPGATAYGGLGSGVFPNPLGVPFYTILRNARRNNPGTLYKPNYITGQLRILRPENLDTTTLDTLGNSILAITAAPNDADRPTGVAAVVQYKETISTITGATRTKAKVIIYPEDTPITAHGVRVLTTTAPSEQQAEAQATRIITQLRDWYQAATTPQANGSVTCKLRDIPASPLATRCTITGPGAVDTLATPVTAVEWDFLAQEVKLTLGAAIKEPRISTIPFPEYNPDNPTDPENPQPDPGPGPTPGPDDPDPEDPEDPDNPDPPTPGPGCNCKEYVFDPDWFTVTETSTQVHVTINQAKLTQTVDDMLADISVDVQVDGLVETTEFGNLRATLNGNTAQGLDTNIHY